MKANIALVLSIIALALCGVLLIQTGIIEFDNGSLVLRPITFHGGGGNPIGGSTFSNPTGGSGSFPTGGGTSFGGGVGPTGGSNGGGVGPTGGSGGARLNPGGSDLGQGQNVTSPGTVSNKPQATSPGTVTNTPR